jgi:hypothetical protein
MTAIEINALKVHDMRLIVADIEKAAGRPTTEIRQSWNRTQCLEYLHKYYGLDCTDPEPEKDEETDVFQYATCNSLNDNRLVPCSCSYDELASLLGAHNVRPNKDGKLFSPIISNGKSRGNDAVEFVTAIMQDYDKGAPVMADILGILPDARAYWYTTHRHTPDAPRSRVVTPYSRPVTPAEHNLIVRAVVSLIPDTLAECLDNSCFEIARAHFFPSCPADRQQDASSGYIPGNLLNVESLIELGRETPDAEDVKQARDESILGDRPGDIFNTRHTIVEVMLRFGWVDCGRGYWVRPGKNPKDGHSAKIYQDGIFVYSSEAPVKPGFYDAFRFLVFSEYGGHFDVASKDLASKGYTQKTQADDQEQAAKEQAKAYFPVIPFPAEILPQYMRSLTDRYAAALQCQFAFMVMAFLTVVSGAIGNSIRLGIKSSWKTAPFLWLAIIDKTGAGKSHPIEAVMDPLFVMQSVEATRFDKDMEQFKIDEAAFKKSKTDSEPPPEPEPMRHFYSSNFTVESLIGMFKKCARGVVIFVDELAGMVKSLNQYKSGKGSDDEQILSLFNCGPLKSDRVTKSGFARESGAAVIGGIQPEVYSGVFNENAEANGMLYRWLPLVMNAAPPLFTDDELTNHDTDEWEQIVKWMYAIPAEIHPETGFIKKTILTVEPAGRSLFKEFHDELTRIQPFMPKRYAGYLPKFKTYCLKFMAILHVLECYPKDELFMEVEAKTVVNAIKLTRYFAGQALQLVTEQATTSNPHHAALQKAIESLRGEAVKGQVLLSRIRERMNELLPPEMQIDANQGKKLVAWLREIGLSVVTGTDNKRFVTIV